MTVMKKLYLWYDGSSRVGINLDQLLVHANITILFEQVSQCVTYSSSVQRTGLSSLYPFFSVWIISWFSMPA